MWGLMGALLTGSSTSLRGGARAVGLSRFQDPTDAVFHNFRSGEFLTLGDETCRAPWVVTRRQDPPLPQGSLTLGSSTAGFQLQLSVTLEQ